jgi:hypothetical protein
LSDTVNPQALQFPGFAASIDELATSISDRAGGPTAGSFEQAFEATRSSRIQKAKPMEPATSRNIAHLLSLVGVGNANT